MTELALRIENETLGGVCPAAQLFEFTSDGLIGVAQYSKVKQRESSLLGAEVVLPLNLCCSFLANASNGDVCISEFEIKFL